MTASLVDRRKLNIYNEELLELLACSRKVLGTDFCKLVDCTDSVCMASVNLRLQIIEMLRLSAFDCLLDALNSRINVHLRQRIPRIWSGIAGNITQTLRR